jgi:hypothetical protein
MRGRNNNRKGPNPLTRSYESNGPDVKIRGTAHHVAEKYLQLARDAHSSGDPVMAENYLQHAEHYFRLIATAQAAQQQAQMGYARPAGETEAEDADDDDDFGGVPDRFASPSERLPQQSQPYGGQPQPMMPGTQPQPYSDRGGYNGDRGPQQQDRQDRQFQPRGDRQDRPYQDRNQNRFNQNRGPRDQRPPQQNDFRAEQPPRETRQPAAEAEQPGGALPAFITSPVRIPPNEAEGMAPVPNGGEHEGPAGEVGGYHLRPRRRRRPRPEQGGEGENGASETLPGDMPVAE